MASRRPARRKKAIGTRRAETANDHPAAVVRHGDDGFGDNGFMLIVSG